MTRCRPGVPRSAGRSGFTITELLVVIGILAMLMAIVTPVVFRARASARNAAIKAEVDMLHMAIMQYKNDYGSFPPCTVTNASNHILRIWPRWDYVTWPLAKDPTPDTALVDWLSGYAPNPINPLGVPKDKRFDFDQTRMLNGTYFPSGKPNSPYIYIDKAQYGTIVSGSSNNPVTVGPNTYRAELVSATKFQNPDTFQILCAGVDETWGTDDDLSNFWKGTRREYLDSLQ